MSSMIIFDNNRLLVAVKNVQEVEKSFDFHENVVVGKNKKSCSRRVSREGGTNIGGLCESTLHLALKYCIEENSDFHEVGFLNFQIDVCVGNNAYEVQTKNFAAFKKKLALLLLEKNVTIVFPIICEKHIFWTNPDTGELVGGRKSPKKENSSLLLNELIYITKLLKNENLSFSLIHLKVNDFKLLCGWSKDKKKGAVRYNQVPYELVKIENFKNTIEYLREFVPKFEKDEFLTSEILSQNGNFDKNTARIILRILSDLEYITFVGKDKRFKKYKTIKDFT